MIGDGQRVGRKREREGGGGEGGREGERIICICLWTKGRSVLCNNKCLLTLTIAIIRFLTGQELNLRVSTGGRERL